MSQTHTPPPRPARRRGAPLAWALAAALAVPAAAAQDAPPRAGAGSARTGDYILAVVNQELVTAAELQLRLARVRAEAERNRQPLPPAAQLRQQLLDALIDERVQITYARETGPRLDEAEIDRAVTNVAVQNQLTVPQLRQRLREEGQDYQRFRNNVRDQIVTERVREREVSARIRVTDAEIDAFLDKRRAEVALADEYNVAQLLVAVPEDASPQLVAERRARINAALARIQHGEAFEAVAREVSDDPARANGGVIGWRTADKLPELFMKAVRPLRAGEVATGVVRSGAGFHLLKLLDKREAGLFPTTQTQARHILLRPSAQLTQETAVRRLLEFKRQIESGERTFEALARANSEDGSAAQGGDLGWTTAGTFVPEFEDAMNALQPGGLSEPVVSRFGVHLIQVVERRQVNLDARQEREQARNILREQKFEQAYLEWIRDLRARAYVELREPPT